MKKVNILGTEYIVKRMTVEEYPKLTLLEANAVVELYSKEIIMDKNMNQHTGKEYNNFEEFENRSLRHEVVHAFFHESGLKDYCYDEKLVEWIAVQAPKMFKAFEELKCLHESEEKQND